MQKAAWHPGGTHLLVLTTDGALTRYLVTEHAARVVQQLYLGGNKAGLVGFSFGTFFLTTIFLNFKARRIHRT